MESAKRNADRIKGPWSPDEDDSLRRLVKRYGARNWSIISKSIVGRSGKSCRLRWCNQLSPEVEHRPFTAEEDDLIFQAHAKYGNKWATISRLLNGRTDNSIKNHWNSTLKRKYSSVAEDGATVDEPPEKKIAISSNRAQAPISASGISLTPGSPSGSDVSELGLPPAVSSFNVFQSVAKSGDISTPAQQVASMPDQNSVDEPSTELTLCLPGFDSADRLNNDSAPPPPSPPRSEERRSTSAEPESKQVSFGPVLLSVMQEMIRKEVANYMGGRIGLEELCLNSSNIDGVINAGIKRIGIIKVDSKEKENIKK